MFNILNPDRSFVIKIDVGLVRLEFLGEILNPQERRKVDVRVAQKFPDLNFDAIPMESYAYTKACETLNLAIKQLPIQLEKLKDWELLDDSDLVEKVFLAYKEKEDSFRGSLKKNHDTERIEQSGNNSRSFSNEDLQPASNDRDIGIGAKNIHSGVGESSRGFPTIETESNRLDETRRDSRENADRLSSFGNEGSYGNGRVQQTGNR